MTGSSSATPLIHVDSVVLIYLVERHPRYSPPLEVCFARYGGAIQLVVSELALMECLVVPYRHGSTAVADSFQRFFARSDVTVVPIDRLVLDRAARLRAQAQSLRGGDAIHLATFQLTDCQQLLTNDRRLASVCGPRAVTIEDLLAGNALQ